VATAEPTPSLDAFLARWSGAGASERANAQLFLTELADLLGVPRPGNDHAHGYSFEFPVKIPTGPGLTTDGRIDLYRRGCFVLEAKQFVAPKTEPTNLELAALASGAEGEAKKKSGPIRDSAAWDDAMWRAKGQAERYARHLPESEPAAPFLLVVDVGRSIEVYADFTQAGRAYQAFPDPRSFRLRLDDLRDDKVRERLRRIWLDPLSLDPAKVSAEVTREIAGYLAILATSLEESGHAPRLVAEFLTRCLFCMFAEDVGLLPKDGFRGLLESLRASPEGFVPKLRQLFAEMQTGTDFSVILNKKLLRFNGGLFEDASVLPLDGTQLGILIKASTMQWKDVEPAIFGTLLERALDPDERHQLGAHYTPRAYVERLVLPTVIEPLRGEWEAVRAAALVHAQKGDLKSARAEITRFHSQLCEVTVLDPACGSGNFLYVTLEHLKRLEGEVLDTAAGFGENLLLDLATHSVDPHQFLGLELNPRAASLAELVLWIGYLQWHFRTRGQTLPAEPVLKKFRNIECRDAVLAWDGEPQPARDERGDIVTVWDRRSQKTDLVTGRDVPDETKRVPLLTYPNARPAAWPKADYIVGNPPFLGKLKVRQDLGDGYAEALRAAYPDVPESADFVMYWWHKAAALVRAGAVRRFGLITTNSLRQTFNRRVVEHHLRAAPNVGGSSQSRSASQHPPSPAQPPSPSDAALGRAAYVANAPLSLVFAVPDHPWVDTAEGAAVRIAMTVGVAGEHPGELRTTTAEEPHDDGSSIVTFAAQTGRIAADLSVGADVTGTVPLKANEGLAGTGLILGSRGFVLTAEEAEDLKQRNFASERLIFPLRNGEDINGGPRNAFVIDTHGWEDDHLRRELPEIYQRLYTTVYPERQSNRDPKLRKYWWLFRRSNEQVRGAIAGLPRYIATVETSKHRIFVFLDAGLKPEHKLVVIGSDDAFHLGVLSSRIHVVYAIASGGWLGVGNDPVYSKTRCFDPFPFPAGDEAAQARIRSLGEELDAHRKRVQAQHPGLSLTAMYNVLEALRAGRALTPKETATHDAGLVSVLRQLHDELDAAVFAAYGWNDLAQAVEALRHGELMDLKTGGSAQITATPDAFQTAIAQHERLIDAEILTRLVALNAARAAEEATGQIRYLRPAYQAPTGQTTQTGLSLPTAAAKKAKGEGRKAKEPWPKALAERVAATERALAALGKPVTPAELAKHFLRAKPEDLAEIMETLVTLGRAHREGEKFSV